MFCGHRKTAQNVPCNHQVITIHFFLFAVVVAAK